MKTNHSVWAEFVVNRRRRWYHRHCCGMVPGHVPNVGVPVTAIPSLTSSTFVESLKYTTDRERGATDAYPNYPVITLATGEGDSEDHAILAAAILNRMGYGVRPPLLPSDPTTGARSSPRPPPLP